MRAIDADALKQEIFNYFDGVTVNNVNGAYIIRDTNVIIDNAPTVDIQTAVMELYRRYQPRLATNVYEFGVELQELLGRYGGGERRCG